MVYPWFSHGNHCANIGHPQKMGILGPLLSLKVAAGDEKKCPQKASGLAAKKTNKRGIGSEGFFWII